MALPEPTGPDDNPWAREFTDLEKRCAAEAWSQYRAKRERDSGPLIWASPQSLRLVIDEKVEDTKRKLGKLAIVQRAIYRETAAQLKDQS